MQEIPTQECHIMEPIEENPRRILAFLLTFIENHSEEGDVEPAVRRARKYLKVAGLTSFMRIQTAKRLDALLRQGYLAAAENNLIEARWICGVTDVWGYIARIRFFLFLAEVEEEGWLEEQGSYTEGIELLLLEGQRSREERLQEARQNRGKLQEDSI